MKKKIMTIALALAILGGFQVQAQDNNTNASATRQEQTQRRGPRANAPKMNQQERDFFAEQAFDGIQLTDAQKAGLKAVKEQQMAKRQERRAQRDSAKTERREQSRQQKEAARAARVQQKRDYLNGVKGVLTPEQYVVFLENIVVESPAPGGKAPKMEARGLQRGDKKGMRPSDRGQRRGDKPVAKK